MIAPVSYGLRFSSHNTAIPVESLVNWLVQFKWAVRQRSVTDNHPKRLRFLHSNKVLSLPDEHAKGRRQHKDLPGQIVDILNFHKKIPISLGILARAVTENISLGRATRLTLKEGRQQHLKKYTTPAAPQRLDKAA